MCPSSKPGAPHLWASGLGRPSGPVLRDRRPSQVLVKYHFLHRSRLPSPAPTSEWKQSADGDPDSAIEDLVAPAWEALGLSSPRAFAPFPLVLPHPGTGQLPATLSRSTCGHWGNEVTLLRDPEQLDMGFLHCPVGLSWLWPEAWFCPLFGNARSSLLFP